MNPDQKSDNASWRVFKWIFGIGILLGAVLIGITLLKALSGEVMSDSEYQWEFAGGGRFEIFEATVADRLTIESNRMTHKMPGTKDIQTWDYQYGGWIDFEMETSNEVVSKGTLKMESEGLILVVGASNYSGEKIIPEISYSNYWQELRKAQFQDSGAAHQPQEYAGSTMEYGLEVEDGNGGWIRMTGPLAVDEADWRSFAVAPVFPRTQAELKLRVTRGRSLQIELSIPNPGYGGTVEKWSEDEKPWERKLKVGTVRVNEFKLSKHKRTGQVRVETKFLVAPDKGRQPKEFSLKQTTNADETGNQEYWRSFKLLHGVPRLKIGGTIRSSGQYRWNESEVVILGEGIFQDDGSISEITLGKEAQKHGISKITYETSKPAGNWRFTLERDVSKLPARPAKVVNSMQYGGVVFLDDETVSSNSGRSSESGGSSRLGVYTDYEHYFSWKGDIKKGQQVRLALVPLNPMETFEFVLPVSELEGLKPQSH